MYIAESMTASVVLLIICMLCWGSWANAFSLTRGQYRFELFYWDYALGVMLCVLAMSALMAPGSAVFHGAMDPAHAGWGILSGIVFNIGNVLLVAAVSLTGMAVAFPVCCGLALLIGVGLAWRIEAAVPAVPMAIGAALILLSMIMDAAAYRAISRNVAASARGIIIAVIGGVFMGAFPPCLQKALGDPNPLDPYAAAVMLGAGILICTILTNYLLMRRPIAGGEPVSFAEYFSAPVGFHALGLLGGAVWAAGTVLNSIAGDNVSVAVSYAFGMGGVPVAALWGVFVWKEFRNAPKRSYWFLLGMFVLFIAGVAVIAWAKSTMEMN
ncbi:MAG: hypothetical protein JW959_14385 [Pirellulales bacterium]|nr:hypothetical protein [Pirellulales bacterium]